MKNQIEIILNVIKEDNPEQTWFTSNEIYKAFHKYKDHPRINDLKERNHGTGEFTAPYVSSLLHNYCIKPRNPKIKRQLNKQGIYIYSKI